jgi:hypothetical protein
MHRVTQAAVAITASLAIVGASHLPGLTPAADAADCVFRAGPAYYGYTFEKGAKGGRVPGHAFVAFKKRPNARVEGGGHQYWKEEHGHVLYLVNGWPGNYRTVFSVPCGPSRWA